MVTSVTTHARPGRITNVVQSCCCWHSSHILVIVLLCKKVDLPLPYSPEAKLSWCWNKKDEVHNHSSFAVNFDEIPKWKVPRMTFFQDVSPATKLDWILPLVPHFPQYLVESRSRRSLIEGWVNLQRIACRGIVHCCASSLCWIHIIHLNFMLGL